MTTAATGDTETLTGAAPARERFGYLDFLRGVALLGIVPENIPYFAYPLTIANAEPGAGATMSERAAVYAIRVLGDYNFLTLFALLFGVGLGLIQQRCVQSGRAFRPLYLRRLAVLAIIGVLHALLLWYGDILLFFAVGGLIAMWMIGWSTRALIAAGAVFLALPLIVMLIGAAALRGGDAEAAGTRAGLASMPAQTAPAAAATQAAGVQPATSQAATRPATQDVGVELLRRYLKPENETRHYREGPFADVFMSRLLAWVYTLAVMLPYMGWRIVGLFLIGAALARLGWFARPERGFAPFAAMLRWGLLIGLPLHLAYVLFPSFGPGGSSGDLLMESFKYAGSLGMAAAYAAIFAWLYVKGRESGWVRPILAVGAQTLTAYILSSVLMNVVFYYYGLAWFNQLTRAEMLAVVPGIWAACVLFCTAWSSRFRLGPLEWIWRKLTYGKATQLS